MVDGAVVVTNLNVISGFADEFVVFLCGIFDDIVNLVIFVPIVEVGSVIVVFVPNVDTSVATVGTLVVVVDLFAVKAEKLMINDKVVFVATANVDAVVGFAALVVVLFSFVLVFELVSFETFLEVKVVVNVSEVVTVV